jgi:Papain-like cysteine protease AvrRpt2
MQELSGAGGNWRVIDEIVDANVVQQQDNLSCGPACGEMLFRNRGVNDIDRYAIASESGVPVSPQVLASVLNALNSTSSGWVGAPLSIPGASNIQLIEVLNTTGSWAAMLWESEKTIGHMIIVDGFDDEEKILIRDPWHEI